MSCCSPFIYCVDIRSASGVDTSADTAPRTRMIFNLQKRRPEGFVWAVTDPYANLVHVGLLRRKIPKSGETRARNKNLQAKMLKEGPASLSPSDRVYLLRDAESMAALHHDVWQMNNANFVIRRAPAEAVQKSDIKNQTIRAADRSSAATHWQTI
jgi:hypothetical protein